MIFSGLLLIGCVILFAFCNFRREKRVLPQNSTRWPAGLLSVGDYLITLFPRKERSGKANEIEKALFITKEEKVVQSIKRGTLLYLLVFAGSLLGLIIGIISEEKTGFLKIVRPDFGEEKNIVLNVKGIEELDEISFQISGKTPGKQELIKIFDATFQELKPVWLAENRSFKQVQSNLNLIEETDQGIQIQYKSDRPEVITNRGTILETKISKKGIHVKYQITFEYEKIKKTYQLPIIVKEKKRILTDQEKLLELIEKENKKTSKKEYLTLPKKMENTELIFSEKGITPYAVLGITGVLLVLLLVLPKEQQKKKYERRNEELKHYYPILLSKIETLIHGGMSIQNAWKKIVEDYKREKKDSGKRVYVYEEMIRTSHQIQSGINQEEAYIEFGKSCGLREYVRLGNRLAQNIRQGLAGLEKALEDEMQMALEERKNRAVVRGEEAGTKLLFPMVLMLGIVIVTLVVPAFMSM